MDANVKVAVSKRGIVHLLSDDGQSTLCGKWTRDMQITENGEAQGIAGCTRCHKTRRQSAAV